MKCAVCPPVVCSLSPAGRLLRTGRILPATGQYADLRLLDPLDDTPTPSTDILAVYTRTIGSDLEIRVDLLDLPLTPDYHLQILLDTLPGGNPWDLMIDLPANDRPTVTPVNANLIPRLSPGPMAGYRHRAFQSLYVSPALHP